jgi:3-oxoacyl-[acyl-carrier protein] reductase
MPFIASNRGTAVTSASTGERVVYVTGGSRGIGLAIVSALAHDGYSVVAIARSATPELDDVQAHAAGAVTFISADLATRKGQEIVVAGLRSCGGLYGLVNNAGIAPAGLHVLSNHDSIARMWSINVEAPLLLCKAAVKSMSRARQGRIVNISSICAHKAFRGLAAYTASKAAIEGFSKVLAAEVGPWGVTVNCIAPGFIPTDMNASLPDDVRARIKRRAILTREVTTSDVAGVVGFFLSSAAAEITAQVIRVDAGATA